MIAVRIHLILSKRVTLVIALVLVPAVFAVVAVTLGAAVGPQGGVAGAIMDAIKSFVPTAAPLFSAVIYFGLMIDVGLFDPLIRWILRVVGNSPARLVVGTAVPAGMVSLDGDGSATFTGLLSMPMTFFMSNDEFYFGVLPILSDAAGNYGIAPVQMARAAIVGQPVHLASPLVPAMLLPISLARVDLADFHKKATWRPVVCAPVMLAAAIALADIPA